MSAAACMPAPLERGDAVFIRDVLALTDRYLRNPYRLPTLATASVDRLMHHAHFVQTNGESHRLAQALAGKGVIPLS